jgi:hypothetical protein
MEHVAQNLYEQKEIRKMNKILRGKRLVYLTIKKSVEISRNYLRIHNIDSGLENRDYGHKGSAALTMRHPSIRKRWH